MRERVVGRWRVGGELQVLLSLCLILEVCSLSVLESCMSHSVVMLVLMYGSETVIWRGLE